MEIVIYILCVYKFRLIVAGEEVRCLLGMH